MSLEKSPIPRYLENLNPEQLEAVLHHGSPLLILAGAGTGKTKVITSKIAYLVREKGLQPESILAVTFTNKAAREMRERAALIEPSCERAVIRTFHSFGAWFLRRNADSLKIGKDFVIYDDGDSSELIHSAMPSLSRQECSRYANLVARAKDYNLEPDSPGLVSIMRDENFRRIYTSYEERLRATGNVDFGDLIKLPVQILEKDPIVAQRTHQRFKVIMVDEYQDSNVAQFQLLQRLSCPETYVCVVGDDDQSIYRFRGAEIRNILSFSKIFPGTTTVKLERNYRSFQSILDIAGNVVSRNSGRLGKTLRATRPGGSKPSLGLLDDADQEVDFCSRIIKDHLRQRGKLSDIAILYRTNAQSLAFEKEFPRKGIAYKLVGALRFYEREEVKDVLAYLALILNPRDEISFRRVVNKPSRGLGDSSVDSIMDRTYAQGSTILEACKDLRDSLRGKGKAGMGDFLSILDSAAISLGSNEAPPADEPYSLSDGGKAKDRGSLSLGSLLEELIKASGLAAYHKDQDEIAGTQKLSNMEELVNAASLYPLNRSGLSEFLETIELDRSFQAADGSAAADSVTLITMHNTKGLEFPIVIVTGLEQGLFPRDDEEGEDLEEQRRLFYVALTRAKDRLYLTACRWRRIRGRLFETQPSRFLTEMDPSYYEFWKNPASVTPSMMAAGIRRSEPDLKHAAPQMAVSRDASAPLALSSEWKPGQAVFHDEYGQGEIVKVSMTESSGPLVIVRFASGKIAQFFPKYTRKLERVKE